MKNILILGAGGDIGQSVFKILNDYNWIGNIIGTDINLNTASRLLFDKLYQIPKCNEKEYLNSIKKIIEKESIDNILPISEPEIRFFHQKKIRLIGKTPLILANDLALSVGLDKMSTYEFLKINNLPCPKTQYLNLPLELDFPFIAKSNQGSGSKKIFIVKDNLDLDYLKNKYPQHILQEFLPEQEGEYTCGLFRSSRGEIRHVVFKRELLNGFSVFGEVIENKMINSLLIKLANLLDLNGSINIQLRLVEGVPYIFEINPRFSSTVRFRDLIGFKDLLWVLQDFMNENISFNDGKLKGTKFYKGFNEYIL